MNRIARNSPGCRSSRFWGYWFKKDPARPNKFNMVLLLCTTEKYNTNMDRYKREFPVHVFYVVAGQYFGVFRVLLSGCTILHGPCLLCTNLQDVFTKRQRGHRIPRLKPGSSIGSTMKRDLLNGGRMSALISLGSKSRSAKNEVWSKCQLKLLVKHQKIHLLQKSYDLTPSRAVA